MRVVIGEPKGRPLRTLEPRVVFRREGRGEDMLMSVGRIVTIRAGHATPAEELAERGARDITDSKLVPVLDLATGDLRLMDPETRVWTTGVADEIRVMPNGYIAEGDAKEDKK